MKRRQRPVELTVSQALSNGVSELEAVGVESARLDSELLLGAALGEDRMSLIVDRDRELNKVELERFKLLLERRVAREPVAYILGLRHFRNLTLKVSSDVLSPRPETELLVEQALSLPQGSTVLDLGTGSGAIALAIKDERPDLKVLGSDASGSALSIARENAETLGLDVEFIESDWMGDIDGFFDLIVSNPPYVGATDRDDLAPELQYEPAQALFAGSDGLDAYRDLIPRLSGRAKAVALEIGSTQQTEVSKLLTDAGFIQIKCHRDLAGQDRVLTAVWP